MSPSHPNDKLESTKYLRLSLPSVSLAGISQPSHVNWVPAVYIETAGVSSFLLVWCISWQTLS